MIIIIQYVYSTVCIIIFRLQNRHKSNSKWLIDEHLRDIRDRPAIFIGQDEIMSTTRRGAPIFALHRGIILRLLIFRCRDRITEFVAPVQQPDRRPASVYVLRTYAGVLFAFFVRYYGIDRETIVQFVERCVTGRDSDWPIIWLIYSENFSVNPLAKLSLDLMKRMIFAEDTIIIIVLVVS